jgi:predicted phage terminase large subunit-like protein
MIEALDAVSRGETRRLMLLLPPGSAKSTFASKLFPAWWLARHPDSSVITACHTAQLAEHFGRAVRGLLDEHAPRLGIELAADCRSAHRFATTAGGEYFAVGIHGAVTGRRADLALIDDPVSGFAEAGSFSAREHLWEWFRSELVTRLKPGGRMVLAMTRWHCDDLAGRLIAQGGWRIMRLPALAEAEDALGRAIGEPLWPEWENAEALAEKRRMLGESHFSALFQQTPLEDGGRLFDPRLLRVVDVVPPGVAVRGWDLAATADSSGDPDWSVGVKLVRDGNDAVYIDDIVRFRGSPMDVALNVRKTAEMDGVGVTIGLPQDPGQAGKSQVMFLTQILSGFHVVASSETGEKTTRAMAISAQVGQGLISMRKASWNAAFLDELGSFPQGRKDDQVDALSRAFDLLIQRHGPAKFVRLALLGR